MQQHQLWQQLSQLRRVLQAEDLPQLVSSLPQPVLAKSTHVWLRLSQVSACLVLPRLNVWVWVRRLPSPAQPSSAQLSTAETQQQLEEQLDREMPVMPQLEETILGWLSAWHNLIQ